MERELFWILNRAGDFPLLDWVVGTLPAPVFTVVLALVLWRAAPGELWLKVGTGIAVLLMLVVLVSLCGVLKDWIGRPRPGALLEGVKTGGRTWTGPGFPSCNAVLWGGIAGLTPLLRARKAFVAAAATAAAAFSVLRVYQGAHWPGDVAAGFVLGWGTAAAWTALLRRWVLREPRTQP